MNGHFICYPVFKSDNMEFYLNPYVTINNEKYDNLIIKGVSDFLRNIIVEQSVGISFKEIKDYLRLLKQCTDKTEKSSNGANSGILLNFDKKEGVRYLVYEDLDFLNQRIRLEQESIQEISQQLSREIKRERGYEYGKGI